jgi:DNA adenine methylase
LNVTSSFTAYNENEFLEDKQIELFNVFEKLNNKGCFVLVSNSDTEFIKNLYKKYDINLVQANRFINSKSNARGKINEVLIFNKDKKYE